MRPEELVLLVTVLVGAAMFSAHSATAQGGLGAAPLALDLRAAWASVADGFGESFQPAPATASVGFDREMLR
jgi:hypothetical protein